MQWHKPVMAHDVADVDEVNLHNTTPPVGEEYFLRQYRVAQLLHGFRGTYEEWLKSQGF